MCIRGLLMVALAFGCFQADAALAYTPESPEVRKMVEAGLKYLETSKEDRFGGKCLIATTFIKNDRRDSPWVAKALEACQQRAKANNISDVNMYDNGLAIIFLCELDATKHRQLIDYYLGLLAKRQKPHGGWGYDQFVTGDTSQSQYGALSLWEAHEKGVNINPAMAERAAKWLVATQDPSGAWGYQGQLGQGGKLVKQEEITCSMGAAGMGSLLIFADLFGVIERNNKARDDEESDLPPGVMAVADTNNRRAPRLPAGSLNQKQVLATLKGGDAWMDKNYKVEIERFTSYYMYALERYKSFQAILDGTREEEPVWYNNGVKYAMKTQAKNGSWETGCQEGPDTAFTILFLIRSTDVMIRESLGDGISIGGIGLPTAGQLKFNGSKLVADQPKTEVDDMIDMIDNDQLDKWEGIDASAINIDSADAKSIRKLEQVARTGPWQARIVAVKAIARTGSLDRVPTLLFALTDPQPEVVLAARDGLQFVSRRFEGFGPPNGFNKEQQYDSLNKWKEWYKSIRPDAPLIVE